MCDLVGNYPSPAEQRGNLEQWGGWTGAGWELDGSCTRYQAPGKLELQWKGEQPIAAS